MYEGNIKLDIITCLDSIIGQYPALRLADDRPMIESDHVILSDFMLPPYIDLDYMNLCLFMGQFGVKTRDSSESRLPEK